MNNRIFFRILINRTKSRAFFTYASILLLALTLTLPPAAAQVWNVSYLGGSNYTNVSEILSIGEGDTIRIWGVEGHTYEGGFTIDKDNVLITHWEGSPARPLITNTSNSAPAVTVTANNVTLQGLNISGNSFEGNGAGVKVTGTDDDHHLRGFNVTDCVFTGNTVTGQYPMGCGGAAYLKYVDNSMITNTTFTNNIAEGEYGGGVYFEGSDNAALTDTTFTNNTAKQDGGGALFYISDNANLMDTTFTNNTATNNGGGAFFWESANATLTDTTFTNNTAECYNGGGAYFYISDNANLKDMTFTNNTAKQAGGGAYFYISDNANLTSTAFTNNTAANYGGGAGFDTSNNANLTDTSFENNKAEDGGGVYFWESANATLTGMTFKNNTAKQDGGGAYFEILALPPQTETTFTNNVAADGGSPVLSNGYATLTDTTFTNNTATNNGGGIYFKSYANAVIKNCLFDNENNLYAELSTASALNETTSIAGTNIAGGPYLGGNVWLRDPALNISEWGTDVDFDGICDQNLTIDGFGTDAFPLVYGGTVLVSSTPTDAFVYVDGVNTTRTTNTSIYLSAGEHILELVIGDLCGNKTVSVEAKTTIQVMFDLSPDDVDIENVRGQSSSIRKFLKGTHVSFPVGDSAIYEINFTAGETIPYDYFTVKNTTLPSGVAPPPITAYEYDEVTHSNGHDSAFVDATLSFRVLKTWFDENGFAPEDVVLYRYHNGNWEALDTEILNEEGNYVRFRAKTPGFSLFAVGVRASAPASELPAAQVEPATQVEPAPTNTQAKPEKTPHISPVWYLVVVLVIGAAYALKKKYA
ncbi:right-handed parallel beta-helix repeat-containing protein [Methanosarcina sp. Mfa9]|uniref:right-handed parallel beta-helix repeat-containing protein n=1 Tax=Methanosarcina sp. Mfa9 TaxID=3439063 RepID=UPI003F8333B3